MDSWWKDEKGATLGLAAVAMIVLLGMVALAVDVGMIMTARTEAQRAADAAALAAAGAAFINGPSGTLAQQQVARETAVQYAAEHEVMNDQVDIDQNTDVTFPGTDSVRVQVRRTSGSPDGPVGTIFARVIGFGSVNVVADATARVTEASQITCPLPLVLIDKWSENDGDPLDPENDEFDPNNDPDDGQADTYDPATTGYDADDIGTQVVLKQNAGQGGYTPSWWGPWQPPGQRGASDYRGNITGCNDPGQPYGIGDQVDNEPGNMSGPTRQGFRDLVQQDPTASWDDVNDCVTRGGDCVTDSPRIKPIVMIAPTDLPIQGRQDFTIRNWAGMFVQEPQGNNFYGIFMGIGGFDPNPGSGGSGGGNSLVKTVQLVE